MPSTQYYAYAGEFGVNQFQLKLQLDGISDSGALVFTDGQNNEYPLTTNRIQQLQSDNLLVKKSIIDNNNTPIHNRAKQLASVLDGSSFDDDAVGTIKKAARELFKTQVRILKAQ